MNALVEDWSQKQRYDDFIELESNVRTFVSKNILDLTHYENESVQEYENSHALQHTMEMEDYIRYNMFPYERIILDAIKHSISGKIIFSNYKVGELGGDTNKLAFTEVQERILQLSRAGRLLGAMTSVEKKKKKKKEMKQKSPKGDEEDVDEEGANTSIEATHYHISCSNCYRSLVSGWFLLYRRLKKVTTMMDADMNTTVESKEDIQPEHEMHSRVCKWIAFCNKVSDNDQVLLSEKDMPLLMGVAKVLSKSEQVGRQIQAAELQKQIEKLFPNE